VSDERLRELERRWRETGALEDGVRLMRERLRCGDEEGVRTAAATGEPAAHVALGTPALVVRLETWLREQRPDLLAGFNPGASDEALRSLEEQLGRSLPAAFQALYRWRDGQRTAPEPPAEAWAEEGGAAPEPGEEPEGPPLELFHGWRLLPLSEIRELHGEGLAEWFPEQAEDRSTPWSPTCVPFMEGEQLPGHRSYGVRCVDLDTSFGGLPGQVVEGHAGVGGAEQILAPSFERWLHTLVASLERGAWTPGDWVRSDYFARAVNPGWPRSATTSQIPLPAYYGGTPTAPAATGRGCLWAASAVAGVLILALAVKLKDRAWSSPGPVVTTLLAAALCLLAAGLAVWIHDRLRHRRYSREFAGQTLEEPVETP
jgi:SMI1 / KNR4 family (SUKH-1)